MVREEEERRRDSDVKEKCSGAGCERASERSHIPKFFSLPFFLTFFFSFFHVFWLSVHQTYNYVRVIRQYCQQAAPLVVALSVAHLIDSGFAVAIGLCLTVPSCGLLPASVVAITLTDEWASRRRTGASSGRVCMMQDGTHSVFIDNRMVTKINSWTGGHGAETK